MDYHPVKNFLITAGEEGTVKIWTFSLSGVSDKELALSANKAVRRLTLLNILSHNTGVLSNMIFTRQTREDVLRGQVRGLFFPLFLSCLVFVFGFPTLL
jgi:hypothetical protein